MPLISIDGLVPQPREWQAENGAWAGGDFLAPAPLPPLARLLTSPDFALEANQLALFSLSAEFADPAEYVFGVEPVSGRKTTPSHAPSLIHSRLYEGLSGTCTMSITFRPAKAGRYRLALQLSQNPPGHEIALRRPSLLTQGIGEGRVSKVPVSNLSIKEGGDYLPHWGMLKRFLHRRCRNSRLFNTIVAAAEMRLGCEEVVSLPQYVALCPTGQCNALCDFCSVTINRTGILKQQLPFNQLERFLAPVEKTIRLYGMEGNGEPTLYARFPELVERLTRSEGKSYLITNGSRLEAEDVPLVIALESINFSLNAATAETHRQVMKLKNFNEITSAIRGISRQRGLPKPGAFPSPQIYVSMVVTNHNVHEVQDFLQLVDKDLGVDVVMVRPLSELGNDLSAVEDLRDIVPYDGDIKDMIDSVADYIADMSPRAQIRLKGDTFASFRPDPIGRLRMPLGFEGRLLPPRRNGWRILDAGASVRWRLNAGHFELPAAAGRLVETDLIDIEPGQDLVFKATATVSSGAVTLAIVDNWGGIIASAYLRDSDPAGRRITLAVEPKGATKLGLALIGDGPAVVLDIDFERVRTPASFVDNSFRIPDGHRWELSIPDAKIDWSGQTVRIASARGGGPYILKSYGIACARNRVIELPVEVEVRRGAVSIGVLNASSNQFLEVVEFTEAFSATSVFFQTGDNDTIRLVIYAEVGPAIDTTITWRDAAVAGVGSGECGGNLLSEGEEDPYLLETNKFWCEPSREVAVDVLNTVGDSAKHEAVFEGEHVAELDFKPDNDGRVSAVIAAVAGAPAEVDAALTQDALGAWEPNGAREVRVVVPSRDAAPAEAPADSREAEAEPSAAQTMVPATEQPAAKPASPAIPRVGALRRIRRALRPERPLACQKPWTDLNNFSVDGRVDICCIATGPSQTRYQLGNLNTDSFQEVWNGPAAREFRRTVNTANPLPPCERCPMLRSFQGLWFDPIYTRDYVQRRTIEYIHGKEIDSSEASLFARALGKAMAIFATSLFKGY